MTRFIEIDEERYTFEDCFNCPLYQEAENGDLICLHPKGSFTETWQESFCWPENGGMLTRVPGYYPDRCPAREEE